MRPFSLACCLYLLAAAPAGAADHLGGDWFIVTGNSKLTSSNPDHPLVKESANWVKDGAVLTILALPSDTAWLVQSSSGGQGINLPRSLWDKNRELYRDGHQIHSVALMAQGGWALLHDRGELSAHGVPAEILARLRKGVNELDKTGTPRLLAFAPDGSWVVLSENDYREHGLPKDLSRTLAKHKRKGIGVRCVAFNTHGDWFLLDNENACFTSNPDHPAYAMLKKLRAVGETLRIIAFTPGVCRHCCILEHNPVRRIRAVLTTTCSCPNGRVSQWVVLAPQVPSLPRQRDVKMTLEPPTTTVPDAGLLKEPVQLIRISGKPRGIQVQETCEMTLYTNRLVPLLAGQAAPKEELARDVAAVCTHVSDDMKTRGFKDFLNRANLRRQESESDVDLAGRTFLYIARHFKYVFPNPAKVDVIDAGKGDCGGLCWLFARVMRANGVPARLLLGRWAESGKPAADGSLDGQIHVKAEFFARGIGWVGVDCAGSVTKKGSPLNYFANDPGDFVVLDYAMDRVVKLWPGEAPKRIGGSQGMHWRYRGNAGKDFQVRVEWTVTTVGK